MRAAGLLTMALLALAPWSPPAFGQSQAPAAAAASGPTAADLQGRISSYRQQLKKALTQGLIDRATADALTAALARLSDKAGRTDVTAKQIAVIGQKLDRLNKHIPAPAAGN